MTVRYLGHEKTVHGPLARKEALKAIWKKTPREYRTFIEPKTGGKRVPYILTLREGGTHLVPLETLTEEEIARKLGK